MSLTLLTTRPDVCLSSSTKAGQRVPDPNRLGVAMKRATETPRPATNNSSHISAPLAGGSGLDLSGGLK